MCERCHEILYAYTNEKLRGEVLYLTGELHKAQAENAPLKGKVSELQEALSAVQKDSNVELEKRRSLEAEVEELRKDVACKHFQEDPEQPGTGTYLICGHLEGTGLAKLLDDTFREIRELKQEVKNLKADAREEAICPCPPFTPLESRIVAYCQFCGGKLP